MATNALTWCRLRQLWQTMHYCDVLSGSEALQTVRSAVVTAMKAVRPTVIPDPAKGADQDHVYFEDGSCVLWDWDNGDFDCEGVRFEYPFGPTDLNEYGFAVDPFWWDWKSDTPGPAQMYAPSAETPV